MQQPSNTDKRAPAKKTGAPTLKKVSLFVAGGVVGAVTLIVTHTAGLKAGANIALAAQAQTNQLAETAAKEAGTLATASPSLSADLPNLPSAARYTLQNPPPLLEGITQSGNRISATFDTAMPGIQGWVIESTNPRDPAHIIYSFADGKHGFSGAYLSLNAERNIENLSIGYHQTHAPKPKIDSFWGEIEKSTWVADGAQGEQVKKVIYGFFDANCIYCHLSWLAFEPYMKQGLQVRWLPVSALGKSSMDKAITMLDAENPAALMRQGHETWEALGPSEAFPVNPGAFKNEAHRAAIEKNDALMQRMGLSGTPAFVFKDEQGQMQVYPGFPPLSVIPKITGMEPIENNHPKLQEFR